MSAGPKPGAATGADYRKPMPRIDVWSKPFWDATLEHRFIAQCDESGNVWFPPGPISPFTGSDRWTWVTLSGQGAVRSWVIFHQKYFPGFSAELPYNVALVQLDEGPQIFTNLVNVANSDIRVDMRVRVTFKPVDGNITMPVFEPLEMSAHE